jgi:hypothetical protein
VRGHLRTSGTGPKAGLTQWKRARAPAIVPTCPLMIGVCVCVRERESVYIYIYIYTYIGCISKGRHFRVGGRVCLCVYRYYIIHTQTHTHTHTHTHIQTHINRMHFESLKACVPCVCVYIYTYYIIYIHTHINRMHFESLTEGHFESEAVCMCVCS